MRTRTYRTALLWTLLLAGCMPRETMPELTDRVFAVAAAQYKQLEGRLTDETSGRASVAAAHAIRALRRGTCRCRLRRKWMNSATMAVRARRNIDRKSIYLNPLVELKS